MKAKQGFCPSFEWRGLVLKRGREAVEERDVTVRLLSVVLAGILLSVGQAGAAGLEPLFGPEKACVLTKLWHGKRNDRIADPAPKFSRQEWSNPYPRNVEARVLQARPYTADQSRAAFENFTLALESAREKKGPQGVSPLVIRDLLDRASALLESRGIAHQAVPDEVGVIEILGDPGARGTLNGIAERMGEKYRVRMVVNLEQLVESPGTLGSYNRHKKQIQINRAELLWPKNRIEQTVLHEIRHAVHSRALKEGRPNIYTAWLRGDLAEVTGERLYGKYMNLEEVDTWGYDTRAWVHRVRQVARSRSAEEVLATLARAEKKAVSGQAIMSSAFSLLSRAEDIIRKEPRKVKFFEDEWDGLVHAGVFVSAEQGKSFRFEIPLPEVTLQESPGQMAALLARIQELKTAIATRNHQSTFDARWIQAMQKILRAGRSVPEAIGWVDQAARSGRALEELRLAKQRLRAFSDVELSPEAASQAMLEVLSAAEVETRRPRGPTGQNLLEFRDPLTGKGIQLDAVSGELVRFIER